VDVHVHALGRQREEEDERRNLVAPPLFAHGAVEGGVEQPVAHEAAVDPGEEPPPAAAPRLADEPPAPLRLPLVRSGRDRDQLPGERPAEHLGHPGLRARARRERRRLEQRPPLVAEREPDLRPGEGVPLDHLEAAAQLGRRRLEELPPGRDVEEERPDLDRGAAGDRDRLDAEDPPPFDPHPGAEAGLLGGGQLEAGDGGDRRERLAPEAEAADPFEVGEAGDLARGVAVEGEERVVAPHPAAVVADGDPPLATALELDLDRPRPGVESVLDELLEHRGGALDDLAGGDLADELIRQKADAGHRPDPIRRRRHDGPQPAGSSTRRSRMPDSSTRR